MRVKTFAITTAVVLGCASASAAPPTVSDIATCNKEAEAQSLTPSASPRSTAPPPEISRRAPERSAPDRKLPDARGGMLVGERPPSAPPAGEKTDPSGSVIVGTADPLLEGMAANRAADPVYRMAYYDCMKRLTTPGR